MSAKKSFLIKLFSESLLIIFSILFALLINEWRNNYKENKRTKTLLQNIRGEITSNQQLVQDLIVYHDSVLDNISDALETDSLEASFFSNLYFEIFNVAPKGIIQGKINNIAWEVAKEDKITNRVSLEVAKELSELYSQQETVKGTIGRIINVISSREAQRKELLQESVLLFGIEIHELVAQERYLEQMYSSALEKMQK